MKLAEQLKNTATATIIGVAEDFYLEIMDIAREQAELGYTEVDVPIPDKLISCRPFMRVEPECKTIVRRFKYDGFRAKIKRADNYSNNFVVNIRWR